MVATETLIVGFCLLAGLVLFFIFIFLAWAQTLVIVRPHEAHVVSKGRGESLVFDGKGRYNLIPILRKRVIIPKNVIEVEIPNIALRDEQNLPFVLQIACKVRFIDPIAAASSFGTIKLQEVKNIVEDTIMSSTRSMSMQRSLVSIMRNRDDVEQDVYRSIASSFSKLGLEAVIFDIKDILDVEGSTVIRDMERVKAAEVSRMARESEAFHNAEAVMVEAHKASEAEIKRQEAMKKQSQAQLDREIQLALRSQELATNKKQIDAINVAREAEILREKLAIEADAEALRRHRVAEGEAEAIRICAEAEAAAARLQMEVEAEAIQRKLEAEAGGTLKLAEALRELNEAGLLLKIEEIRAEAAVEASRSFAEAFKNNSKVFLPSFGDNGNGSNLGNFLVQLIPGLMTMEETGTTLARILGSSKSNQKEVLTT